MSEGLRGGKRRELCFVFERRLPPRAGLWAYPRRLRGFPHPGLSPGGRGEPQVVAAYVEPPVPDLQPALEQERLEFDPFSGAGCAEDTLARSGGD